MKVSARSLAVVLMAVLMTSPTLFQAAAAAQQTSDPTTLYSGTVVSSPLQSMSDLNSINNINMAFSGVLSSWSTALWIRPFYHLLTANDTYLPVFAKSYQIFQGNNTYIVHLRNDTGWNDGQPVTAWDFLAYGVLIGGVGAPAYNYKVIDNYTISIQIPNNPAVGLHGLSISSFVFGPDLANGPVIVNYNQWASIVKQVLGNYSGIQAGNASVIQKMSTLIFGYKTSQELFSGAYYPTAVSSSEIILSKNPHYFNAKNLSIDSIGIYQFTSPNAQFQYLDGGQLSVFFTYATTSGSASDVPENYKTALPSYVKEITPQGYAGPGLFFNNATSVVSNVHVRKAIAYALNRTELALAGGSSYAGVTLPIGMPEYMWPSMCPASCQSQMNPYNYSIAGATNEMKSAGYTLQSGAWTSQNGTAVTLTLVNSRSGDPTWLAIALDLQTQLKTFGITVNLLNPSSPGTYETSGKGFDMLIANWGFWVVPWDVFRNLQFLNGIPYPVMHFTANVTVPGFGSITANALQDQILNNAKNITDEARIAQGLSYVVDQYLPYLTIVNQKPAFYVNTQQFNWPDASSPIWGAALVGTSVADTVMVGQETGVLTVGSGTTTSTTTTTTTSSSSSAASSSSSTVTSVSTTTNTATSTTTAVSTTTAISTSTATSTIVQTSTVPTAVQDNTTLIVGVVIIVAIIALVGAVLARRRPAPSVPPRAATQS